ncbi:MAG: ATP-binding protein [Solirubrobacteraceae bacterium]
MSDRHDDDPLDDGDGIPDYAWLARYLRIPGARFVRTPSYELLADGVEEACEDLGITVAYGNPGAGKTFALHVAIANRCRLPVTWLEPEHRPTLLALTEQLLYALGEHDLVGQRRVLVRPLIRLLGIPRLVVVDEAQRLTAECIDHLRYLSDRSDTNFALALAGGVHCMEVLNTEPQLARRCPLKVEFTHLDREEIQEYMPRYHPMYVSLERRLLNRIDDEYAHGMIGLWANMTKRLHKELDRGGETEVNEEMIEAAFVRLDATG